MLTLPLQKNDSIDYHLSSDVATSRETNTFDHEVIPSPLVQTTPSSHPPHIVSEHAVGLLFENDHILFHALNDEALTELAESRRPAYCTELLSGLAADAVTGLSMTALVKGHRVDTYRGTGIIVDATKVSSELISKGDANSCTDDSGHVVGGNDFQNISSLCNYIKTTPSSARPAMNEVKGDFARDALAGFAFRASTAKSATLRQHENNAAYLKLSLLQAYCRDTLNVDCKIYTYQPDTGTLTVIGKEPERRRIALSIVNNTCGLPSAQRLSQRLGWFA
ncbi:hypothetical protein [Pseudomonas entomophila]|uniref:hypothetical protein n=1 Tax=Pseudomonas entomophila TaxID=312306 RepID=UPI001F020B95|nr:hypothetical protein [Pseudomonas entomophila]MCG8291470.1 hypothetical protein [Pseudomonas entomophila]